MRVKANARVLGMKVGEVADRDETPALRGLLENGLLEAVDDAPAPKRSKGPFQKKVDETLEAMGPAPEEAPDGGEGSP